MFVNGEGRDAGGGADGSSASGAVTKVGPVVQTDAATTTHLGMEGEARPSRSAPARRRGDDHRPIDDSRCSSGD